MTPTLVDATDLHTRVVANGGLLDIPMDALKRARHAGRLGCHVRTDIAGWLRRANIGWLPERLPNDQDHLVTLYAKDTAAGRAIDIARHVCGLEASPDGARRAS